MFEDSRYLEIEVLLNYMAKCYFSIINFILILLQVSPSSSISEKLSLLLDENSNVYVCV